MQRSDILLFFFLFLKRAYLSLTLKRLTRVHNLAPVSSVPRPSTWFWLMYTRYRFCLLSKELHCGSDFMLHFTPWCQDVLPRSVVFFTLTCQSSVFFLLYMKWWRRTWLHIHKVLNTTPRWLTAGIIFFVKHNSRRKTHQTFTDFAFYKLSW